MLSLLIMAIAWPSNMCVSMAGLSVESRELTAACWHDPKSGFFAVKTLDCDGAHRMVMLTKDRRVVNDYGYDTTRFGRAPKDDWTGNKVEDHPFAAKTKHGVAIGDTKSRVLAKLGRPTKSVTKKGIYWCALYKKVVMDDKENGSVLRNTYIFKNGKLIEIMLNLDSIPGCGENSLSDDGWPWTKF